MSSRAFAPLEAGAFDATEKTGIARDTSVRVAPPPGTRRHWTESAGTARTRRLGLRFVALFYLLALLGAPVAMIFYRTFEHGLAPAWNAVTQPNA
ncbi:MAG TPA: hypothetical protein VK691_05615, partial [Solirubrobacteraceae bacterium]|nr:hypothetical protein [Solirubrobacteraceae bacterium]